mmetsp:Transcript_10523/g.32729  ORF Transcript_10523/g.32729 Transcript_10523/m.32729 type:complete len:530 (+) Transcript_10523:107-1696(+)
MGCGANGKSLAQFQSLLDEAAQSAEALRGELQHERQQGERLRGELAAVCKEHIAFRQDLEGKQRELDEVQSQARALWEQLAASEASAHAEATRRLRLDSRCSSLECELHSFRVELCETIAERQASEEDCAARNAELALFRASALRLQAECNGLRMARESALAESCSQECHGPTRESELQSASTAALLPGHSPQKARRPSSASAISTAASETVKAPGGIVGVQDVPEAPTKCGPGRKLRVSQRSARRALQAATSMASSHSTVAASNTGASTRRSVSSSRKGTATLLVPKVAQVPPEEQAASKGLSRNALPSRGRAPPPAPPPRGEAPLAAVPPVTGTPPPPAVVPLPAQRPAPHEDPTVQVFQFDFSVFDFLGHEELRTPPESESEEEPGPTALALAASPTPRASSPPPRGSEGGGLRLGALAAAPLCLPGTGTSTGSRVQHLASKPEAKAAGAARGAEAPAEPRDGSASSEEAIWVPVDARGQPLQPRADGQGSGGESLADDDWPRARRSPKARGQSAFRHGGRWHDPL